MSELEKILTELNKNRKKEEINTDVDVRDLFVEVLGGLFSNDLNKLEESLKQEKDHNPKNKESVHLDKKETSLYKTLSSLKEKNGKLCLSMLDKRNLTKLVNEKLSIEEISNLFDVSVEVIEYAIITHNISIPKEKDLLEDNLIQVMGLNSLQLNEYLYSRIEFIQSITEEKIKLLLVAEFIKGLAYIGYQLGLTGSENQLML